MVAQAFWLLFLQPCVRKQPSMTIFIFGYHFSFRVTFSWTCGRYKLKV